MRYTCSAEGVVGCTIRAIQFHKIANGKGVNGPKNSFDICYTQTDYDNDQTKSDTNKNICYNPPVAWPTTYSEKEIDEIIGRFLDFIEHHNEDGFITNPNRNKKTFGQEYLQKSKLKNE